MGVRVLGLVLLAVGSSAFEVNTEFLEQVSDDLHTFLSSNLRALVNEHARPQHAPLSVVNGTCKPCVQEGAKYLMEHTVAKMKEMCTKTNSCIAQKVCGMMAKHQKVAFGMMFEHTRPMSLAMAYCTGKGACDKPDDNTMDEIAMGSEPHEAIMDNFDKIDWSEIEESTEELMPFKKGDDVDAEGPPCKDEMKKHHMPVKPMCMKRAMRHVMGMSIMKVKAMCAKSKCPKMQKICKWMGGNREVSMGMLAAKVEPWKFAFGFCVHRHHHGHHGHGEHHHGHGGWHHGPHQYHEHHDEGIVV